MARDVHLAAGSLPMFATLRHPSLLLGSLALAGCTVLGGYDEFTDREDGGGDATGGAPSPPWTVSEGGAGARPNEAGGSVDPPTCQDGCDDDNPCTEDRCESGACATTFIDGPCSGGICRDGECVAAGTEDCANGIDDSSDSLVDCADPTCVARGYQCAPVAPSGWQGPGVLSYGSIARECAGGFGVEIARGQAGITAAPATCSACSCTPSAGSGCAAAAVTLSREVSGCDGLCSTDVQLAPNTCTPIGGGVPSCGGSLKVGAIETGVFAGTCTPSPQNPTIPAPVVEASATFCASSRGAGCDGAACVPESPPGFTAPVCVGAAGDLQCPSGYPNRTVFYQNIVDTRSCTACSCGAAPCLGEVDFFSGNGNGCGDGHLQFGQAAPSDGSCAALTGGNPRALYVPSPSAPKCIAQPASATGAATPADPFTVCCGP